MKKFLPALAGVLVFGITLLPYLQTSRFEFSNMDDYSYVLLSDVHRGFTASGVRWAFNGDSAASTANWHPLTFLSLMFDAQFFGPDPGIMHIHNALLHAANGALLFFFLLQLIRLLRGPKAGKNLETLVCALSALFWSLHPLRAESVAWISQRKDVLFLFYELLACMAWLKYLTTEESVRGKIGWYAASCFCFLLAFAGKPMAIMFPVLAALLEWLVKKRITANAYWGLAGLSCVFFEITRMVQIQGGAMETLTDVPFGYRLVNAAVSIGGYLWKTVCPMDLYLPYMYRYPEPPDFLIGGLCVCGGVLMLGAVCFLIAWRKYAFARIAPLERLVRGVPSSLSKHDEAALVVCFGLLWFVISLVPVLGLAAIGYAAHADRYTYLPSVGLAVVMVWFLADQERKFIRTISLVVLVCVVVSNGIQSFEQAGYWRDDHTFFSHTLKKDEANPIAHRNLGVDYLTRNESQAAAYHLGRAVASGFEYNRSVKLFYIYMLLETGKIDEAEKETLEFSRYADSLRKYNDEDYLQGGSESGKRTMVDPLIGFALVAAYRGNFVLAHAHIDPLYLGASRNMDVRYAKALITEKEGDRKEALRLYRETLEEKETPMNKFVRGHIKRLEKDLQIGGEIGSCSTTDRAL